MLQEMDSALMAFGVACRRHIRQGTRCGDRSGETGGVANIVIMRGADRFVSAESGLTSRHSFSFGRHYDPGNVGFGLLVMNNDDVIEPDNGYPTHPHRDVEIVTWVLEGALVHRDSTGAGGVIHPGLAQRLSAGRGVQHSEFNDGGLAREDTDMAGEHVVDSRDDTGPVATRRQPLRFVQMWVPPDTPGVDPSYEQHDVSAQLASGDLITVASGMPRHTGSAAIGLGQRSAAMHIARLRAGHLEPPRTRVVAGSGADADAPGSAGRPDSDVRGSAGRPDVDVRGFVDRPDVRTEVLAVTLPNAPFLHLYIARGAVDVEGVGHLDEGDAARITDEGGRHIIAANDAEVIVWEMHTDISTPRT
ncbi:pirin family protein, partial [Phytoactinopolyspora endophytica]|uniref:pirin family protein n=1 Tax=Phytoactinopolyspora endophytica TaxID=1642495 RepID=UPI00197B0D36